ARASVSSRGVRSRHSRARHGRAVPLYDRARGGGQGYLNGTVRNRQVGPAAPDRHYSSRFSSSDRSFSRRAAASFPACTARPQLRWVLSEDAPYDTPVTRPESFCTGTVTADETARTARSTAATASTALVVTWSTLSSWSFTRSTVPPTLRITGSTSCSVRRMSPDTRPITSASRRNAYASAR